MGNVITFPAERRRPHVVLIWDWAFDQYRVEVVGFRAPAAAAEFHDDYGIALDCLMSMGERLGLPMVDCTSDGRAA